jgi:hypothetical protein
MPFQITRECPKCGQPPPEFENLWDVMGDHDCIHCGAKDVIEVIWETEFGLDPVEDEERDEG